MKKFMITAVMAAMLITTAAEYGSVVNVMAAASSTTKKAEKKTTKTTGDKEDKEETVKIEKSDSLVIKTDDLSEDAAVSDCGSQMREALNVCEEPDGPYMYADNKNIIIWKRL